MDYPLMWVASIIVDIASAVVFIRGVGGVHVNWELVIVGSILSLVGIFLWAVGEYGTITGRFIGS